MKCFNLMMNVPCSLFLGLFPCSWGPFIYTFFHVYTGINSYEFQNFYCEILKNVSSHRFIFSELELDGIDPCWNINMCCVHFSTLQHLLRCQCRSVCFSYCIPTRFLHQFWLSEERKGGFSTKQIGRFKMYRIKMIF